MYLFKSFKYRLIFTFIAFLVSDTYAQDSISTYGIGINFHYGFISPHKPLVNEIIKGHTQITELSFFRNTSGTENWEQYYNYPQIGITALFVNTGNRESLGNGYGVFPFINFPLNKKRIKWNLKFGFGVGYIEKPFDRVDNYKNLAIGSNFNALIYLNNVWSLKLTDRIDYNLGISLTHFSNGSLKRPNLGINLFSINSGINYNFGKIVFKEPRNIVDREKSWNKYLVYNSGFKEIDPIGGKKYWINSLSGQLIKNTSNKSSFGFGLDGFYNTSLNVLINRLQNEDKGEAGNFRFGISGIYGLTFNKVSMLFQTGWYLYSPYNGNGNLYTRLSTRYFVTDKIYLNAALKTHYAVADFIEYGIGIKLN